MNGTDNQTRECNPLGLYSPGEPPVPTTLLWAALVCFYSVIIIGTLGNALALWCVATCTKTWRPIKVLLFSVFLPTLAICLVTGPVIVEGFAALLKCDQNRISKPVLRITSLVFVILAQIERTSIVIIAVVRAAAVWAPHRPKIDIRGATVLVVVTCIYAILTGLKLMKLTAVGQTEAPQIDTTTIILSFITITLPPLITAAAYILMIFVIQQNKRSLVACQQQSGQAVATTTMDQVTQAMLAVFISNLVFSLPHSIFHLMGKQPVYNNLIFHIIYFMHFMVDPLVYMWFHNDYRKKICSSFGKMIRSMSSSNIISSVLQTESTTSCDQQEQKSSTHSQEESNL